MECHKCRKMSILLNASSPQSAKQALHVNFIHCFVLTPQVYSLVVTADNPVWSDSLCIRIRRWDTALGKSIITSIKNCEVISEYVDTRGHMRTHSHSGALTHRLTCTCVCACARSSLWSLLRMIFWVFWDFLGIQVEQFITNTELPWALSFIPHFCRRPGNSLVIFEDIGSRRCTSSCLRLCLLD